MRWTREQPTATYPRTPSPGTLAAASQPPRHQKKKKHQARSADRSLRCPRRSCCCSTLLAWTHSSLKNKKLRAILVNRRATHLGIHPPPHLPPHEGPSLEDLDLVPGLREVHRRDHPRQPAADDADLELLVLGELDIRPLPRPKVVIYVLYVGWLTHDDGWITTAFPSFSFPRANVCAVHFGQTSRPPDRKTPALESSAN